MLADFPDTKTARALSPNGRAHWATQAKAKALVGIRVHQAATSLMWFREPVRVTFRYVFPTRRRRDIDNLSTGVAKAVLDTLVRGGWLEDDDSEHVVVVRAEVAYEKGSRRLEVVIEPVREV